MTIRLTPEQARGLWMRGQGLVGAQPLGSSAPVRAVRQACGLQAQDMFAATLGVRVRSTEATIAGLERARNGERSVLWTWAMRGTLHLLATEDADWLLPLIGPVFVAAAHRRRQQLGLDEDTYERGVQAVREQLAENGPSTREELVGALTAVGIEGGYRIERHLLYRAALEGITCMGPDRGSKPTFVLLEDWLGRRLEPLNPDDAPGRLAARYLAAHAPATPADLAAWSGLPNALLRKGWQAVASGLTEVILEGRPAWLPRERLAELDQPPLSSPVVQLLPAFDTYLLGHRSRELVIDPACAKRINAGGGMIKAVLLVDGRVEGTWQSNRKGRRVNIAVDPFSQLTPEVEAGIAAEIADIERFLA